MPIFNWWRLHETNDVSFLLSNEVKVNWWRKKLLFVHWRNLKDEHLQRYGIPSIMIAILEKQRQIAVMKLQKIITGDRSLNTLINIKKIELDDLKSRQSGSSNFYEVKAYIEKTLGFAIDVKRCSVTEWHSYLDIVNKKAKKNG